MSKKIELDFLVTSHDTLSLGSITRACFKRTSKNRDRLMLTIISTRGGADKASKLPVNQLFITITYFEPANKSEEKSLKSFMETFKGLPFLSSIKEC